MAILAKHQGHVANAARELKIPRQTMQYSVRLAEKELISRDTFSAQDQDDDLEMPSFPDEDVAVETMIDGMTERFLRRKASHDAHTWFPVGVKDDKPIGILWIGDPHVDDNGCNWPVLRKHIAICKDTPGLYGANIGDTTNNWAGRLAHLYAEQDASRKTARRLAQWFMVEAGIKWIVFLIGNHDAWGDGAEILARMGKQCGTQKIVCHDWEARFCLAFPNGWSPRIYAAHNFPGHSQWNPLHGPMKEGQLGQAADLYVCGHLHNWATFQFENAARGGNQLFIRVKGYKFLDDYARRLGKHEQESGCSIMTVFDPRDRSIIYFENIEKGADYLTKLRG